MTPVPKPLNFLRPQYKSIKAIYDNIQKERTKASCAEVGSVVGMVMYHDPECETDTLMYRLVSKNDDIGAWGHEYIRLLTVQICYVWDKIDSGDTDEFSKAAEKQKKNIWS